MAAAHAQQVHADWDTMVAEFDSAMAAAPDQLIAARAAWARGEKAATSDKPAPQEIEELHEQQENDLTTPTGRDALTPHSGVERIGPAVTEAQVAIGDTPAPQDNDELQEQQDPPTTPTDRDALTPHSGVELTGPTVDEAQVATGDKLVTSTTSTTSIEAQAATGDKLALPPPTFSLTSTNLFATFSFDPLRQQAGATGMLQQFDAAVLIQDAWSRHCSARWVPPPARAGWLSRLRAADTHAGGSWANCPQCSWNLEACICHSPTDLAAEAGGGRYGRTNTWPASGDAPTATDWAERLTAAEPVAASASTSTTSSGLAPLPPHTPTKGSNSSWRASEPGSPAVSPPRPPALVEPQSDAEFHAVLAALKEAPAGHTSTTCWSQPVRLAFDQPAAERQFEAEQQPRAEKERQPAPEQQPGVAAPPTGQFWQTDDSDSEEEEEKTAGWKAGRTAATFERYTRFADLDAVASRRPVM